MKFDIDFIKMIASFGKLGDDVLCYNTLMPNMMSQSRPKKFCNNIGGMMYIGMDKIFIKNPKTSNKFKKYKMTRGIGDE